MTTIITIALLILQCYLLVQGVRADNLRPVRATESGLPAPAGTIIADRPQGQTAAIAEQLAELFD